MSYEPDDRTPVIVGVGQSLFRETSVDRSPIDMMVDASHKAEQDAGATGLLKRIDTIATVPVMSWRYVNPAPLLAREFGATPTMSMYPLVGGNSPQMLMNMVCERIRDGETEVGLVVGAEAVRSRSGAKRGGTQLRWEKQGEEVAPADYNEGTAFDLAHPAELESGILMPVQVYPLFENALRHQAGRTAAEHTAHIAKLWEGFSAVASQNPNAWDQTAYSAEEIADTHPGNRMVGFPYNIHMVSNQNVDMSAAVIVTTVKVARELGIPADRCVFPLAGADGKDPFVSARPDFVSSAAIRLAGNAALDLAGVAIDDVAHLDIYSCFPSAVQIACSELNIPTENQLTVWGGLCFGGGPWNNPVTHAIASMVDVLRDDLGSTGFVTANGGAIQKHSFGLYSSERPHFAFRSANPQAEIDAVGEVGVDATYVGDVTIETWTVMGDRDGALTSAHAAMTTSSGDRCWGQTDREDLMVRMLTDDMVGVKAHRSADGSLSL